MPFTPQEIQEAGKAAIDFYLKNKPIDQIAVERPILKDLMAGKKSYAGAKEYIVEQLRKDYASNFQWFNGSQTVTYNTRNTLEQSKYPWRSAHDGYAINEDRLAQNGIIMHEGSSKNASQAERIQLTNLLEEQNEVLRLGFEEKFSAYCVMDGTSSPDAITGIEAIVSLTPAVGIVGGINAATNPWWRNHVATGVTTTDVIDQMESAWRACVRTSSTPDRIYVGWDFLQAYIAACKENAVTNYTSGEQLKHEGGTVSTYFKGVPVKYVPEFDTDFGGMASPTVPFAKRCYFICSKHLTLRPLDGQDMVARKPPRHYSKYEYYIAITWRGAITCNKRNAHAVLALA